MNKFELELWNYGMEVLDKAAVQTHTDWEKHYTPVFTKYKKILQPLSEPKDKVANTPSGITPDWEKEFDKQFPSRPSKIGDWDMFDPLPSPDDIKTFIQVELYKARKEGFDKAALLCNQTLSEAKPTDAEGSELIKGKQRGD